MNAPLPIRFIGRPLRLVGLDYQRLKRSRPLVIQEVENGQWE